MSNVTLYRKYRPKSFKAVLGQEHVTKVLEAALKRSDVSHAYLFSGPRGTGKTSVARILASELGCSSNDLFEIDGASNRGIDDVRELRDAVHIQPFDSPVKVYIIDEVHMLTRESFNALLKTLEEPPSHVVFVLATTELHKVPDTVISRCQSFIFKKPSQELLKNMILSVAKEEGTTLEAEAASLIAFLGEGSFRDAQGILQKVLTVTGGKKITSEAVLEITGSPEREIVHNFVESLLNKEKDKGLSAIGKARDKNVDMRILAKLILRELRFVMLITFAPQMKNEIEDDIGADEYKYIENLSKHENIDDVPTILTKIIDAYGDMRGAYIPELALELALLEISKIK